MGTLDNNHPNNKQRGAVLVVSLLMLLVMTILGVAGMGSTNLEQRMAANNRDRDIAFQAAELALRDGERKVRNNNYTPASFSATCVGGLCTEASGTTARWRDGALDVWNTGTRHFTYSETSSISVNNGVSQTPVYILEWLGYVRPVGWSVGDPNPGPGDPEMYRITAIGYGLSSDARVMLQSTYQKNP